MQGKKSAGLLMYVRESGLIEVLLVHPGGPFWKAKDEGAWSIPKGEPENDEDLLAAAVREFREEIGFTPQSDLLDLGWIKQKGGKVVYAWAFEAKRGQAISPADSFFEMEWPPRSGKIQSFPEIDRAEFFSVAQAERKINDGQRAFLGRLLQKLDG
jgi:predicted NUDIX family NTP pyrophosphohydrolase